MTEDSYILHVHRIVGQPGAPVVFLQHGLEDSSATWVLAGPEHGAPAFRLAEQGYDVWLGNFRGNSYSRAHLSLNPDVDNEYWRFTWDEMARHDLPAMLDYVMEETGKADLSTRSQRLTTCCYASSSCLDGLRELSATS